MSIPRTNIHVLFQYHHSGLAEQSKRPATVNGVCLKPIPVSFPGVICAATKDKLKSPSSQIGSHGLDLGRERQRYIKYSFLVYSTDKMGIVVRHGHLSRLPLLPFPPTRGRANPVVARKRQPRLGPTAILVAIRLARLKGIFRQPAGRVSG